MILLHTLISVFDQEFTDFLKLGWDHIIDVKAYDHLLFVMTLCAFFTLQEWRKILVIVTAFTIGHSLTLALSTLDLVLLPKNLIEVLIPLTILFTALTNVILKKDDKSIRTFDRKILFNYCIALVFGLIHGLGFANNFRFMLGEEASILKQLFAFNTGLELGQISIVLVFMLAYFILSRTLNIIHREWMIFFSGAGAGLSVMMIFDVIFK